MPASAASRGRPHPPQGLPLPIQPELVARLLGLARSGGAEFAEVFAERTLHTSFALDERRLKRSSVTIQQGVGVRAIRGAQTGYAYADGFAPDRPARAAARAAASIARDGAAGRGSARVPGQRPGRAVHASCIRRRWRSTRPPRWRCFAARMTPRDRYDPRIHEVEVGLAGLRPSVRGREQRRAVGRGAAVPLAPRRLDARARGRPAPAGLRRRRRLRRRRLLRDRAHARGGRARGGRQRDHAARRRASPRPARTRSWSRPAGAA